MAHDRGAWDSLHTDNGEETLEKKRKLCAVFTLSVCVNAEDLNRSRAHLHFDTDADAWCETYNWNQYIPSKSQRERQCWGQHWCELWLNSTKILREDSTIQKRASKVNFYTFTL